MFGIGKKKTKRFLKSANEIEHLIETNLGCIASDRVTIDGCKVGYMYREEPSENYPDSGWRFLAGDESEEYMMNSSNHNVFALNTICNYDQEIIPFLELDFGTAIIRNQKGELVIDNFEFN